MDIGQKVSSAALYTDFNELARLRADATKPDSVEQSKETNKEVASQIEAMFFQMVLKSMRDAHSIGESAESDQTRFYQDMFDKQITLEISKNASGNGTGLASVIEQQISGLENAENVSAEESLNMIRKQINHSASLRSAERDSGQE